MKNAKSPSPLPSWVNRSGIPGVLSVAYSFFVNQRNRSFTDNPSLIYRAERKVISIGGIRAGGTGKTPLSLHIAEYLQSKALPVALLSRGYGRKNRQDRIFKPGETARWEDAGDEPSMFHSQIPQSWVGISPQRSRCARVLSQITPPETVFVLDDGFQHRKLFRDLDLVCVDNSVLDDRVIPRGYLREPRHSLQRADAIIIIEEYESITESQRVKKELGKMFPDIPCFVLFQEADCWVNFSTGQSASELPFSFPLAFCGIARPERFFNLLKKLGIKTSKELTFSDHHVYNEADFGSIHELYSQGMVTTEKDAYRLFNSGVVIYPDFWYLKIRLKFSDSDSQCAFNRLIDSVISNN
ncbi:MAG: tetraacyldisaccharide 4'-kinase [Fibrobacter sp.]|nr:tetraacyldisaccharide 4'-kinase [Fibrobacter sp.]